MTTPHIEIIYIPSQHAWATIIVNSESGKGTAQLFLVKPGEAAGRTGRAYLEARMAAVTAAANDVGKL